MDTQTPSDEPFVNAMFDEEPAGTFAEGYVFRLGLDLAAARNEPANGYWHCDIANHDTLTWSEKVYDLFGLERGAPITRKWAVGRYSARSRSALEKIRKFALNRDYSFMLDAEIDSGGATSSWIRVVAIPVIEGGKVVGLHGIKRAL